MLLAALLVSGCSALVPSGDPATNTPTPTRTPNVGATVQAAVNATQTAQAPTETEETEEAETPTTEPTATLAPTATDAPPELTSGAPVTNTLPLTGTGVISGTINGASWWVSGVPETAEPWKIFTEGDAFGTTATLSDAPSTGFGEPGVRTTEDCVEADADPSAYCSLRTNVQETFKHEGPAYFEMPEADPTEGHGHVFCSGAYFTVTTPDGVVIRIETPEDVAAHLWVTGPENQDGSTPNDGNGQVKIEAYNPGFTMCTVLPPGQRISLDYRLQQNMAAMVEECGNDGCLRGVVEVHYNMTDQTLTVTFFDADGNEEEVYQNWTVPTSTP